MRPIRGILSRAAGIALAASAALTLPGAAQAEKFKIFLSMSYIGNDWQAEELVAELTAAAGS